MKPQFMVLLAGALLGLEASPALAQIPGGAGTATDSARGTASREDAARRDRSGVGALPPMDMRIQGDGVALPAGVDRKAREEAELAHEAAEEKARKDAKDGEKR